MSSPGVLTPVAVANSELHELHSSIIGQHYLIKVRLPEDYARSHAYL